MLMARENPEPLVGPHSDLNDSGPPSHPLHSPQQYHTQHQGCQGTAPGLYPQHQHASAAQYHYPADIFSGSPPPRGAPQAAMYAGQDGMGQVVQEEHPQMGGGAPMGMSRFHGVTYNKGKWQASVFCHGRWVYCETFDTEVAAAAAYDRAIRHFRPQDAELYVNFKQSLPMAQPGPMPGAAYQTYWDTGDGTEDGQSGVSGSEGRGWVNHVQQRSAAGGAVPQRVSSSNYPGMMAAGVSVIPSSMAPTMLSEDGTSTVFRGGMVKSASVSTLLAQTTLSDSSAVPVSAMEAPMMQWPPGVRVANVASGVYDPSVRVMTHGGQADFPDISAASLLLGAEGGPPPAAQNPRIAPAGMKRVASAVDSSAMRTMHVRSPRGAAKFGAVGSPRGATNSAGTGGSGGHTGSGGSGSAHAHASLGVAEGGVRRVGSAQELASSVNKPAGGVRQAALSARSTRAAATRASNRRANSRYAKDKKEEGEKAGAKAFGRDGAGGAAAKSVGVDKCPRTEEEMQAERVRVYQALLAGQERLHDQMRAHQTQHEEQQRRAAQREADKATEALRKEAAAPATGSPQAAAAAPSTGPMLTAQAQVHPHQKGHNQSSPENDALYGSNSRTRAARLSPGFPPTSEASAGSGGKVPRRIPSEPHSLAALGVAGMGGRHSPTVTRAMSGMGMRRVKSTHNFGHHHQHHQQQQQQQYMPMQHMQMSMPMQHTEMLRASPSMPVFPTTMEAAPANRRLDSLDSGQQLPNITEEREDPLKLPECVNSMFLDEPEHGNDDLLSLMKDLTDQGANNGLDLDWTMPLEGDALAARGSSDSRTYVENMPHPNLNRKVGPNGAGAPVDHAHEQPDTAQPASDLDPSFFHVEGADQIGMSMLDEVGVDDFSSAYLDL